MSKNPYIEPYDHFKGYEESAKKLKNDPANVMFDKMCYELFEHNPTGKAFLKFVEERYLIPGLLIINTGKYTESLLHSEGFKHAYRSIISSAKSHAQRIQSEKVTP